MKIGIPKETTSGERRVAIVSETAKRLTARGLEVAVESGAGAASLVADDEYRAAGAAIEVSAESLWRSADLLIKIHAPTSAEAERLRSGAALICLLYPLLHQELIRLLASRQITAIAVDQIPRTTLAQTMDALSSQATAAGYRAVILAAHALPRFFPMLMTAAGTIAPARVLVLGAGVAGLQAIAVARRLGAVVEAFDVRAAVREQIESLGARFVDVALSERAEAAGGYARELAEESQRKTREVIGQHLGRTDACITTALVPGKRAPVLITAEMVGRMKAGSVIVDLAAEQGGNCELTEPGQTVVRHGVSILGPLAAAGDVPVHASQMYSRNITALLTHLLKDGSPNFDFEDEITRGSCLTHQGQPLSEPVGAGKAG